MRRKKKLTYEELKQLSVPDLLAYLRIDEDPIFSPSRLDLALECMRAYWYQYFLGLEHPINASIARGKLLHRMIEKFWKEDNGVLVPFYHSSKTFANTSGARWQRGYVNTGESDGQKIEWFSSAEPYIFKSIIKKTAMRIYNRYVEEEPRIAPEIEINCEFEGIKLMANIDELRKDLVIRDHKSGRRKHGEFYLANNNQMTDYSLCLFLALQQPGSETSRRYPNYKGIVLDDFLKTCKIEIHNIGSPSKYDMPDVYLACWETLLKNLN